MGALRIFLAIVFLWASFSQAQEYETISWSEKRLTWKDFKGEPPTSDRVAATTASGISYRFSTSGTRSAFKVDYEVSTHFYPKKSWYKPELADEVVLSHEQLHFDISELFARKLRKELSEATFTPENVKKKIKALYNRNNQELNDFQNRYDEETNFSRNRENQSLWNKKVAEALKIESFSSY